MSRRWQQVLFQAAIIVALIVGLRLILGEWNWWMTAIGVAALLLSNLWSSGARRGEDIDPRERP
ncbi:hypothetical protein [uncultured Kocuria sp.]|uniref:hypothetical protein n=1 Tax=uncultured Kocuria sp. TaxID=259305 RepID=UPI00261D4544|nr:hypothetical protein [uncultured Kocuria sp.]